MPFFSLLLFLFRAEWLCVWDVAAVVDVCLSPSGKWHCTARQYKIIPLWLLSGGFHLVAHTMKPFAHFSFAGGYGVMGSWLCHAAVGWMKKWGECFVVALWWFETRTPSFFLSSSAVAASNLFTFGLFGGRLRWWWWWWATCLTRSTLCCQCYQQKQRIALPPSLRPFLGVTWDSDSEREITTWRRWVDRIESLLLVCLSSTTSMTASTTAEHTRSPSRHFQLASSILLCPYATDHNFLYTHWKISLCLCLPACLFV